MYKVLISGKGNTNPFRIYEKEKTTNRENKEFMIEISVSFNGETPEHEGYYTSPDAAKEAIDQLYELFNLKEDELI